ncbi:MBL fold metallo-hydrolase [Novacetimonas hansenii]|uniref:MBL fold metallo-hydrolase n=1 Tax=Novacetimonas hansenii TaxID=436 RepID=UPI00079C05EC|nr:MBL fold metallo-hydrolase [Novacetimonas hansenii]WEQ57769.1 MBL fold metallo-hydrolase [Novacetimonas hansenii]CUW46316.1 ribonuclease Z [Novacetimonas hansenii]
MSSERIFQAPEISRYRVGEFAVTVLSDGSLDASLDLLDGIDQDEALSLLGAADTAPSSHMNINAFVIEAGARTILIDGGAGNLNGWGGRLIPALIAAGYDPLQIDTILLTHGHSDHVGGLAGPLATKHFRNVEKFFLHQAELNFWRNEEIRDAAPVAHQRLFDVARNVLDAYQQQITPFEDGDVLLPGITAVHLPGHTPGHSGYLLESEDDSLLIWGDVLHFPHIQVARPDVTFAFDHNPGLAAKTRRKILTELSRNNRYVTGVHFNAPVRAKIESDKDAFRLTYDL